MPGVRWRLSEEEGDAGGAVIHLKAFDQSDEELAEGHLSLTESSAPRRATLDVHVDPALRRRGIGSAIVRWSEAVARERFAPAIVSGEDVMLRVDLGSVADDATRRFLARHGLTLAVEEEEMRRTTGQPPACALPGDLSVESWSAENARRFHSVYADAFSTRPGFPGWDLATWRRHYASPAAFRPDLSLLVSESDKPVAYVICGVEAGEGWIIQMGVTQAARGRGIAAALLSRATAAFGAQGMPEVVLEVATNNPEARALYSKLGFRVVGTYQSYRKWLTPAKD